MNERHMDLKENIYGSNVLNVGTRCRSQLRRYAMSQEVAGSIPDEVIVFFFQFT
jgi:hypothetical protein